MNAPDDGTRVGIINKWRAVRYHRLDLPSQRVELLGLLEDRRLAMRKQGNPMAALIEYSKNWSMTITAPITDREDAFFYNLYTGSGS